MDNNREEPKEGEVRGEQTVTNDVGFRQWGHSKKRT